MDMHGNGSGHSHQHPEMTVTVLFLGGGQHNETSCLFHPSNFVTVAGLCIHPGHPPEDNLNRACTDHCGPDEGAH